MNATKTINALVSMPFAGASFDEAPHAFGQIFTAEEVPLVAKRLSGILRDRNSGEEKAITLLVVYADDLPVICEIMEMKDASDEPTG